MDRAEVAAGSHMGLTRVLECGLWLRDSWPSYDHQVQKFDIFLANKNQARDVARKLRKTCAEHVRRALSWAGVGHPFEMSPECLETSQNAGVMMGGREGKRSK